MKPYERWRWGWGWRVMIMTMIITCKKACSRKRNVGVSLWVLVAFKLENSAYKRWHEMRFKMWYCCHEEKTMKKWQKIEQPKNPWAKTHRNKESPKIGCAPFVREDREMWPVPASPTITRAITNPEKTNKMPITTAVRWSGNHPLKMTGDDDCGC